MRVAEALADRKSVKQIRDEFGDLGDTRKTLQSWGLDLPLIREPILEKFGDFTKTDLKEEEVQALLNEVTNTQRYKVLLNAGLIVNLNTLTREAGLHLDVREMGRVCVALDQQKIPRGRVVHYKKAGGRKKEIIGGYNFIAETDRDRAIAALDSQPELADMKIKKVSVLAGPGVDILPNTTKLQDREVYGHVGSVIDEIVGTPYRNYKTIGMAVILLGSPVTVYKNLKCVYYARAQKEELVAFLAKRLVELGLLKNTAEAK